jgi:hypothetical protein
VYVSVCVRQFIANHCILSILSCALFYSACLLTYPLSSLILRYFNHHFFLLYRHLYLPSFISNYTYTLPPPPLFFTHHFLPPLPSYLSPTTSPILLSTPLFTPPLQRFPHRLLPHLLSYLFLTSIREISPHG